MKNGYLGSWQNAWEERLFLLKKEKKSERRILEKRKMEVSDGSSRHGEEMEIFSKRERRRFEMGQKSLGTGREKGGRKKKKKEEEKIWEV